ncbi:hypothetical protein Tsubulata_014078, partial [Turnera subulata]
FVNGRLCKDPKLTTVNDFTFSGLNIRADTSNRLGSNITFATVNEFPGVNTLGISLTRVDFAANGGLNPLHLHPRASEILLCMEGTLYAGFVTARPEYRLFAKILRPGDAFVFPQGLIHFQLNVGKTDAVAFANFNSQNPGVIRVADSTFGAYPPIASECIRMRIVHFIFAVYLSTLAARVALAYDPDPLQDICVAINETQSSSLPFEVNGEFCKRPEDTTSDDFFHSGLNTAANTNNSYGFNQTFAYIEQYPGINTLGVAVARNDYEKGGVNIGETPAYAIVMYSSQSPGTIRAGESTLGAYPSIPSYVVAKAFHLDERTVELKVSNIYHLTCILWYGIKTYDAVLVNGKFCKDPKLVTANDFGFSGLNIPRDTGNKVGSNVTLLNVDQIPGLNTLGISLARLDYAPNGGLNPPHIHPRATEILLALEGTLYVGFVTSNPDNRLITKVLYPGDVFVFPIGLIHFQFNGLPVGEECDPVSSETIWWELLVKHM